MLMISAFRNADSEVYRVQQKAKMQQFALMGMCHNDLHYVINPVY
jgi:hypothetical protein